MIHLKRYGISLWVPQWCSWHLLQAGSYVIAGTRGGKRAKPSQNRLVHRCDQPSWPWPMSDPFSERVRFPLPTREGGSTRPNPLYPCSCEKIGGKVRAQVLPLDIHRGEDSGSSYTWGFHLENSLVKGVEMHLRVHLLKTQTAQIKGLPFNGHMLQSISQSQLIPL